MYVLCIFNLGCVHVNIKRINIVVVVVVVVAVVVVVVSSSS